MAVETPSKANFAARSFLIVEDFEAMRGILRDLLRRCGAKRIEVAANTREAVATLKRGKIDVVLCDYHLGPGENGQQLLEECRRDSLISAATIWIMVTAEKTTEMVMGAVEHIPDDYLLKPITEAALQTRLERLIARKAALADIAAAMRAKEYLRALSLCKTRMEQDPGNPLEILRIQCDLYQLIGKPEQARAVYESILAKRDVSWAKAGLAKLHLLTGELHRAHDLLEQIIESNPNYLEAYDLLARAHQKGGAWLEAERVLQRAVALSPNSPHRQSALGDTAARCAHLEVAEAAYTKALRLTAATPLKSADPYLGLARVYSAQNKPAEALKALNQLTADIERDDARLQAKAEEVRVHHESGNAEAAAAAAKEVCERIQGGTQDLTPAATLSLAETFMLMGKKEAATDLVRFVVRNNHEDEELAERAHAVFDKGGMGEEGRALVQESRQATTEAMNQGVKLASAGDLDAALDYMRQAKALTPRNPRLLLNHAYVVIKWLQKNGWRHDLEMEARRSITTARQLAPADTRAGELLAKLESLC